MQVTTPEIWNEAAWQPAFAKLVQSYQARVQCTQLVDQALASMFEALLSIVAVDLRKRFDGKIVFGAYMDDILLEQCNEEHGANIMMELLSDSERSLRHTFL